MNTPTSRRQGRLVQMALVFAVVLLFSFAPDINAGLILLTGANGSKDAASIASAEPSISISPRGISIKNELGIVRRRTPRKSRVTA